MNLKPLFDKIVVKAQDPISQTTGGLFIVAAKNEGVIQGEVLAVGPGKHNEKGNFVVVNVAVGNTVLFNAMSGCKFEQDNDEYIILSQDEIVAILAEQ